MAIVSSTGALGGFVGPFLLGAMLSLTGSFQDSMLVLGGVLLVCALAIFLFTPAVARKWGEALQGSPPAEGGSEETASSDDVSVSVEVEGVLKHLSAASKSGESGGVGVGGVDVVDGDVGGVGQKHQVLWRMV